MADDTPISKLNDAVQKLRETSDRQQLLPTELIHKLTTMDSKYEQIFQELRKDGEEPPVCSPGTQSEGGIQ